MDIAATIRRIRQTRVRTSTKLIVGTAAALLSLQVAGFRSPSAEASAPPQLGYKLQPLLSSAAVIAPKPVATAPAFVLKRVLPIEGPFRHGDWVWNDAGVPAGPVVITVDLSAQVLSVFRDGYEIGAAVILYGADEKPTPLGAFPISQKDRNHISNLYNAPMPYMMRLTNDGVTIHGSDVRAGAATHGCVGVPVAFAAKLFAQAKVGDVVIVTNGKRMRLGDAIVRG